VQPLAAAATMPTKTKGLVNRRLIIAEFPRIYAGSRLRSAVQPAPDPIHSAGAWRKLWFF